MGGLLRECGCYDGPWSEDDQTLVSVRCDEHRGEPALEGYQLAYRDGRGRLLWPVLPTTRVPRMAIPRGRRRRR